MKRHCSSGGNEKKKAKRVKEHGRDLFTTVPFEIIYHITSFLSVSDNIKLAMTCHSMKQLVNSPSLWKRTMKKIGMIDMQQNGIEFSKLVDSIDPQYSAKKCFVYSHVKNCVDMVSDRDFDVCVYFIDYFLAKVFESEARNSPNVKFLISWEAITITFKSTIFGMKSKTKIVLDASTYLVTRLPINPKTGNQCESISVMFQFIQSGLWTQMLKTVEKDGDRGFQSFHMKLSGDILYMFMGIYAVSYKISEIKFIN